MAPIPISGFGWRRRDVIQHFFWAVFLTIAAFAVMSDNDTRQEIIEQSKNFVSSPWPDLELLLPMHMADIDEYRYSLIRSLKLFWPKKYMRLLVVLDAEKRTVKSEEKVLGIAKGLQVRISYHQPSKYYKKGWDRQQLIQFWADNFTKAQYVGFVDTDSLFISPVDVEDIFDNGKPIVIGGMYKDTTDYNPFWNIVQNSVADFTGLTSFIRCMSYFPVVVKVDHLRKLRSYIERYKGKSFDEAFLKLTDFPYSQFGVMCTYLWNFHREEYKWHIQQLTGEEGVSQLIPDSDITPKPASVYGITDKILEPIPRICSHSNYLKDRINETIYRHLLLQGYCIDELLRNEDIDACFGIDPYEVPKHMFCFEWHDWTYHPKAHDSFLDRQNRRLNRKHSWDPELVRYLTERQNDDFPVHADTCGTWDDKR